MSKARRWTEHDLQMVDKRTAVDTRGVVTAHRGGYRTNKHEQQEQIWLMDWARHQQLTRLEPDGRWFKVCMEQQFLASAGGAMLQGEPKQRAMHWAFLRKMGCKKDAADLVLFWPSQKFHGMHIELKKRHDQFAGSSDISRAVSPGQTATLHRMLRAGYFTCVAFGWVEAATKVCHYLQWQPKEHGL